MNRIDDVLGHRPRKPTTKRSVFGDTEHRGNELKTSPDDTNKMGESTRPTRDERDDRPRIWTVSIRSVSFRSPHSRSRVGR